MSDSVNHQQSASKAPLRLQGFECSGFAANSAQGGDFVNVWTRLAITSDEPIFHSIAENLVDALNVGLAQLGKSGRLKGAESILLLIRPHNEADLWVNTADMHVRMTLKHDRTTLGEMIYEDEIADVTGVRFPDADIGKHDRVICLFRVDWRFALFFDFNPEGDFQIEDMERDLGTLYRNLKYRHVYDALDDETIFGRLTDAGWFPFAEIIGDEFKELIKCATAAFPLQDVEQKLLLSFDDTRIERMRQRWLKKPHFASRETILQAALRAYAVDDPVAVIKIVSTEMEGVLAQAYRDIHGTGAKIKVLLEFAASFARQKFRGEETLLLTEPFAKYLAKTMFANFDPDGPLGDAGSRHAVSHGAADPATYTKVRALQALLTLDQFAFYT